MRQPRVVIVGAGFGGLEAAKALRRAPVDVVVIDRQNYHLFQPLLYQVATAGLSPANIAAPIRRILRKSQNTRVVMAEVTGVDTEQKLVHTSIGDEPYDWLILAPGADNFYFGNDEWAEKAPGLKTLDDATLIRAQILQVFERAESSEDQKPMRFVIIGAGPTGVEMAGSIAELSRRVVAADFRRAKTAHAEIVIVEGADRVLTAFPEELSAACQRMLDDLGVEVRLKTMVKAIDDHGIDTDQGRIDADLVIWGAGVKPNPVAQWLDAEADRGRVKVEPDLTVPGEPNIFVIGDCAYVEQDGKPVPGVSPAAMQEGRYAAKVIHAFSESKPKPAPFRYKDKGNLATIGRRRAVAHLGRFKFSGLFAWLLWLFVHILYLIGFRNRTIVLIEWMWAYITFERGARLILKHDVERSW